MKLGDLVNLSNANFKVIVDNIGLLKMKTSARGDRESEILLQEISDSIREIILLMDFIRQDSDWIRLKGKEIEEQQWMRRIK